MAFRVLAYCVAFLGIGTAQLDEYIRQEMETANIPGASIAVFKGEDLLFAGAYGLTDTRDPNARVTNSTAFQLASISKLNIGVAVMMLVERGWLDVNTDVNEYLSFSVRNPNYPDTSITVQHLLQHTSSISEEQYNEISIYSVGDPVVSLEDFLQGFLTSSGTLSSVFYSASKSYLSSAPGASPFHYSNVGAALAAYIAELVAKQNNFATDFNNLVKEHIHKPLGVTNVGYFVSDFAHPAPPSLAYASPYTDGEFLTCAHYSAVDYPTVNWRTSAIDLARFMSMFVNDGTYNGTQILTQESVATMKTRAQTSTDGCEGVSNAMWYFAKGMMDGYVDDWIIGHNGADAGTSCEAGYNPKTGVGFVFLTNVNGNDDAFADAQFNILGRLMATFDTDHAPSTGSQACGRRLQATSSDTSKLLMDAPCTASGPAAPTVVTSTTANGLAASTTVTSTAAGSTNSPDSADASSAVHVASGAGVVWGAVTIVASHLHLKM